MNEGVFLRIDLSNEADVWGQSQPGEENIRSQLNKNQKAEFEQGAKSMSMISVGLEH